MAQWLSTELAATVSGHKQRVTLIGWSLGGLYAREIAKAMPHAIRQVITLGSPIANVAHSTNVGWLYEMLNGGAATIDSRLGENATNATSRSDDLDLQPV